MPIYEYRCEACKRIFEVFQKINEEPVTKCQFCGGNGRKVISPVGFILKGSGFYVNDYPSESRKKETETKKESKDKPKESKKDED